MRRPQPGEYEAYYAAYIERAPDGDVVSFLEEQGQRTIDLFGGVSESRGDYRYAPEKWSVKQLLGHVMDTERVFAYRALALARGDTTPLPGFEQDPYVDNGGFDGRSLSDILREYSTVRAATVSLFRSLAPGVEDRTGTISGYPFVVCALPWLIAGHELHHLDVLQERYLGE